METYRSNFRSLWPVFFTIHTWLPFLILKVLGPTHKFLTQRESENEHSDWISPIQYEIFYLFLSELLVLLLVTAAAILKELCLRLKKKQPHHN